MATWEINGQQLAAIVFHAVQAGFNHTCEGCNGEHNNYTKEQLLEHHRSVAINMLEELLPEKQTSPEEEKS